jgi:hypothetical protein
MFLVVQRYMDDGYGNIHLIEEGEFEQDILDQLNELETDAEVFDFLLEIVPATEMDLNSIGNPSGYGNEVDEYRIYVDGKLYRTV